MDESENMDLEKESNEDLSINFSEEASSDYSEEYLEDQNVEDQLEDPHVSSSSEESEKKEYKETYSSQFKEFKKKFDQDSDVETKLQSAIDFMEVSLAQGGTPHFRSFWEARRLCLPLFKENISPILRSQLWNKYSELSKEARRLKEILDEQSAFAVEQIEIAIVALEKEIEQPSEQKSLVFPETFILPYVLKHNKDLYQQLQAQLNGFNVQASRINALRKELLKTEMRVRQKNKFFQRLSSAGDQIFPKRKELIKQISTQFMGDVEAFIKTHFGTDHSNESLYHLREDIKSLQGLAKILTLNTNSFTQTRTQLSECWDKIKIEEKERKKERVQQRIAFKHNAEMIQQQIQTLKEAVEQGISVNESQKKTDEIIALMRRTELGRDELKVLRENLTAIRQIVQSKMKAEEESRQQQEQERYRQKKEKYFTMKDQVENLLTNHSTMAVDQLVAEREMLLEQMNESNLAKVEKQEIERLMKPLRDIITDKQEQALLSLSDDDRQTLQQLRQVLHQRKERRQEVKTQLELLRKNAGLSGLDFEKALSYTAQVNEEKERLDKANQGIEEIEQKIKSLQSKLKA
jgi:hypothetical protein